MKIKKIAKTAATLLMLVLLSSTYANAQAFNNLTDCLVTNDIGIYIYDAESARIGNAAGVVGGADHFKVDHLDSICNGEYSKNVDVSGLSRKERFKILLNVTVQVTQHTGGDSDRWLLHEVDRNFRNYYGMPSESYRILVINGNTIMAVRTGGGTYQWLSGNKVIHISYTDLQLSKPQPLEIVQAYLAKHPSTLPSITSADLRTADNQTKWIKEEIDRRLWLCDKWNAQYQAGKATQTDLIYNLVRSMNVFLNYRQKYFSVAADADLKLLSGYQENKDIASIQTKLSEYKGWWSSNKAKSISLP